MDGMFVPNISFGMPVLKAIQKHANKPLDVHLMIENPDRYIKEFVDLGADIITVHYEACPHLHRTILVEAGANVLVAGSSVFGADNPAKAVVELKRAVD